MYSCKFLLAACVLAVPAAAHMSLVVPISRNAVDRALPQWKGGKWWPFQPECEDPSAHFDSQHPSGCVPKGTDGWGCNCWNGTGNLCDVAQSCLWFSNGCSIGCDTCTGIPANPATKCLCGDKCMNATVNDPMLRTYNRKAEAGSDADIYKFNPWRAPGFAPVLDACGMAGGSPVHGGGESKYTNTKFAKQGDHGSVTLPAAPTGVLWKAGATVTAKWSIRANHGGGYQYRLCPASETPTEECFIQTPMPFADTTTQILEMDDSVLHINGTYVSKGTKPEGSTWAMNPLPYSNPGSPAEFEPPCQEWVDHTKSDTGRCSGRDPYRTLLVDKLVVPAHLKSGDYVLQLRWDCEKSAQVWTNCADITIEGANVVV